MKNNLLNLEKLLILIVFSLAMVTVAFSQTTIVNYDYNSGSSFGTLTPGLASNITSTVSGTETFTTYAGTTSGGSAFTSNSTAGQALAMSNSSGNNSRYWTFQLGGSSLINYKTYKLYVQAQRSSSGAQTITIAYGTDGSNFTNFGTTMNTGNGSFNEQVFDLSSITSLDNQSAVYFRILVSGASGSGTLRIDNFEIQALLTGPPGPFGPTGPTGVTGPTGAQGVTGPTGIQGITGDQGLQGIQGVTGAQGMQGIQGASGDQGLQGIQGITGSVGPTGADGSQNAWSLVGNTGTIATSFIGTLDTVGLNIKTNNITRINISKTGNINMNGKTKINSLYIGNNASGTSDTTAKLSVGGYVKIDSLAGDGFKTDSNSTKSYKLVYADEHGVLVKSNISAQQGPAVLLCNPNINLPWTIGGNKLTGDQTYPNEFFGTCNNYPIRIFTHGDERMRITANGNVGIGTINPSQKLEIAHDSADGGIALNRVNSTNESKSEIKFCKNGQPLYAIGNDLDNNGVQTFFIWDHVNNEAPFIINKFDKVGIGIDPPSSNPPSIYKLYVEGGIQTRDVKVTSGTFVDYVFNKEYQLMTISELEKYIKLHNHLPNFPSATEVEKNEGFELGDMQLKLLKTIEEQMLYIISLQKQIDELRTKIENNK